MKAVVITSYGDPDVLKITDRPIPSISPNELLIEVKAAGVNRPDIFQRKGNYPAPKGASKDIPGLEVSGIIKETGKNVKGFSIGDAVCGLVAGGGYAEYINIADNLCLPVPKTWSFEEAASLPETFFTVWHNVFQRGQLKANEHFLVHGGSSGIGIAAIQLAKAFGVKVFVTAGSEEKCTACLNLGADQAVNYKAHDFSEVLKTAGIDVILDMIGGDYFQKNINILREDGRLIYINAMKGPEVSLDIKQLMQKRLQITGSTLRNRPVSFKAAIAQELYEHVWPLLATKQIQPLIYRTFPLEKAAQAHHLMESSTHIGKIILTV